jgi:hypothetical protein
MNYRNCANQTDDYKGWKNSHILSPNIKKNLWFLRQHFRCFN